MTSLFAAHRAAQEFADLVDGSRPELASTFADLTDVLTLLVAEPRVEARPAFVADLRSRLLAAADVELAPATPSLRAVPSTSVRTVGRAPARQRRLGAAAAAALVVVGGTAGVAAAAQGSLPGQDLYPVKRGIEAATSALHTSDSGKGSDLLRQATTRVDEVQALTQQGADTARIQATLKDFTATASRGAGLMFRAYEASGRSSDIAAVRDFAASQRAALTALADVAPASMRSSFSQAADDLNAIDTQAVSLCAGCGGADLGLGDLGGASSTAALHSLLAVPASYAARPKPTTRKQPTRHTAPPEKSTSASEQGSTAPAPTVTPTVTPSPTATADPVQTVKNTVKSVTDPVTGVVDQVGQSTGLSAVTDTVTNLLDGLTK